MKGPKIPEIIGRCRSQRPAGTLRVLVIPILLIVLLLSCAGCIHTGGPGTGAPVSRSSGADTSRYFLYQNIVNTSAGSMTGPDRNGTSSEDRKATVIRDAIDSRDPVTRDFAVSLIQKPHGGPFNLAQICDLWEAVYSRWTYVDDPNSGDYYSPASHTIALGLKGDCDDFAIVVAAMIESVGGDARVIYASNGTAGHAYPEVYIGTTKEEFEAAAAYIRQRYRIADVGCHITNGPAGPRYWLNLDWWSRYPGGRFFADDGVRIAYYPDGHWERVEA
ncbi:transglutaminase family protein [uncultured Methanoregula sp.]|uniref:transglutaminase-like domain-containing protein n=1 Tax=uncultured Methanoregula sp. TaxID=1005933 RepID=UPI002AABFB3B|nr:transglutaminase family protein [uncultured Methanoregula sp.]